MAYVSPGVYVEEAPSTVRPIAGVSTSTAAFVSIIPDTVQVVAKGDTTPTRLVDVTLGSVAKIPVLCTGWNDFTTGFGPLTGSPASGCQHRCRRSAKRQSAHAGHGGVRFLQ